MFHVCRLPVLLFLIAMSAAPAEAGRRETIAGPVEVRVMRVLDGDTFLAEAHVWPGQRITVRVRVRGVDAPELHTRCVAEKAAGLRARAALEALLASGPVTISAIGGGKYYGRVLADVTAGDGIDVGRHLLATRLVAAYRGGRRTQLFC